MPKANDVCIVIPAHSWPQYIGQALNSIERQVVCPGHTIVVLDAPEQMLPYRRYDVFDWVEWIRLDKNCGPSVARNIGIEAARRAGYKWVVFLDEDDILHPRYLQRMLQSRQLCPDISIHYCDWVWFDAWAGYTRTPEYSYERLLAGPFMMSTSLIRIAAWEDVHDINGTGFDPDVRGWEDWLFFLEAGALGHRGARIGMALVRYRRHHGKTSSGEAHGHLQQTVTYIRDKMARLHHKELTYTWDAKKSSLPPRI